MDRAICNRCGARGHYGRDCAPLVKTAACWHGEVAAAASVIEAEGEGGVPPLITKTPHTTRRSIRRITQRCWLVMGPLCPSWTRTPPWMRAPLYMRTPPWMRIERPASLIEAGGKGDRTPTLPLSDTNGAT